MSRGSGRLAKREDREQSEPGNAPAAKAARAKSAGTGGTRVGDALRSVYSETVNEEIPDEFMNLLNQLK